MYIYYTPRQKYPVIYIKNRVFYPLFRRLQGRTILSPTGTGERHF